ncbi:aromatic acid exporter family protein [Streptomyces sp. N2-109]|uniref:Aromatic acid exporter family protein n=1 Tax=Streptomyces gossypii TaxID=2883101 RepID=A0ABT2JW97_9ACTN|nr:aromatic acid exporter family protein [Streptomyces gossypii]MCT2591595.1 aromatic acid exporter family protein [Streptomyces gossypii]
MAKRRTEPVGEEEAEPSGKEPRCDSEPRGWSGLVADGGTRLADWWEQARHGPRRGKARLQRAAQYSGPERETLLLLLKSLVAGVFSWGLAQYVIASPQPTYAPFTALLVVQSTVYRSLLYSTQYILAVIFGVLAAGAAGPLLGVNVAAFAAMLAVTLAIGRWQRLGPQGLQVSVAAVFAYNALSGAQTSMLWEIVMMALLGAGVGVCVSLLILPPLRYRTAAQGVQSLSAALATLLHDMAEGLEDGLPERGMLAEWLYRARQLDSTVASARHAVETGAESVLYNPRRMVSRRVPVTFSGYRTSTEALGRAAEQLRSIAYALLRMCDSEGELCPDDRYLRAYGDLLEIASRGAGAIGATDDADGGNALRRALDDGYTRHSDLTASVGDSSAWPSHGVLLTDVYRLLEEFDHAHTQGSIEIPARRDGGARRGQAGEPGG